MGMFAAIIFVFSFAGIAALFTVKSLEARRGAAFAPHLREKADMQALRFKSYLMNSRKEAEKILPLLLLISRYLVHRAALSFSIAAHFVGVQAHRFADFVSHKHHFERQAAPRSEFLKEITRVNERPTLMTTPVTETPPHPTMEPELSAGVEEPLYATATVIPEEKLETTAKKSHQPRNKKKKTSEKKLETAE